MARDEDDIEELEDEPSDKQEDTSALPENAPESEEKDFADNEEPAADALEKDLAGKKELGEETDDLKNQVKSKEPDLSAFQAPSKPSEIDRYKNFMDQYRKLQDQRYKADLVNGLISAGGKVGQSMAGKYSGNFVPDQSGNQMLAKMAERPAQDFEQSQVVQGRGMQLQNEMAANDPNSPQSIMVRKYLNQRIPGLTLADDVSANDAMMLMKTIGRPTQTKFQKVNGTWTDPDTGQSKRMSAVFDPGSGQYKDADTGKSLPGFLAEGLNPFQTITNPNTGQKEIFNKSRGSAATPMATGQAPVGSAQTPQEVNASLDPVTRKELNDKVTPAFNKETEKIQQRLNHVPVILQRLEEAQTNPAALPQLKAEMARFDVGDQRLAQQELDMFAKRQGYKGLEDWAQAKTTGTITPDFADQMRQAITHVSTNLHDQLSDAAEKHAKTLANRMPPGQKVDPKVIAPLLYGDYKPSGPKKEIVKQYYNKSTGQTLYRYSDGTQEIKNGQ